MFDVDLIIPCFGRSEIIEKGIASLAIQWHKEFLHVTLVNDCSPNTDCNYQDLIDKYSNFIDIRCIRTPENVGQGLARQYGIDNTCHGHFMFMDEDDQLGSGVAFSVFVGAAEEAEKNGGKDIAVVSGSLFAFDNNSSNIIENGNRVWVNSKLYSRKFIEKHNVRFNEAQSRHAEDYYWMSCFFFALDNDVLWDGILLDNNGMYYLWYPNEQSQSRIDPHYGYMLSGYTMNGSVNILKYIKKGNHGIVWSEDVSSQYKYMLLNMTMYSYFTLLSFVRHVAETEYIPKLEQDWYLLRDSCSYLRHHLKEFPFSDFLYTEWMEQYYIVKNNSDVMFTEPWVSFDRYVRDSCEELSYTFEELLQCKETMRFDTRGVRVWGT